MSLRELLRAEEDGTGSAPPAPAPVVPDSTQADFDEVARMLNFDPFAEPAPTEETPPAPAPAPAPRSPAAPTETHIGRAPAVDPGTPPPVQPPAPQPGSGEAALRAEVARLQGMVEGFTRAAPPSAPAPVQPQPDDPFPEYDFTIPDGLMQAFASDDVNVRKQGLSLFSKGLARGVHAMIRQEYRKAIIDAVPPMIEQAMSGQTLMRQVFDDFYGTHKDLNRPELRPMIVQIAQQVWQGGQYGRNWNAAMRDAVATQARAILAGYSLSTPAAPPRQPGMAGPAARPPIDPRISDPNAPENIERTLFG